MSDLFAESFGYYGGDADRLTEGRWLSKQNASLEFGIGDTSKWWLELRGGIGQGSSRVALGSSFAEVISSFRVYFPQINSDANSVYIYGLEAGGSRIFSLRCSVVGAVQAYGVADALLGSSAGPVFSAGTAHTVEVRVLRSATVGEVEVRIDGEATPVLNLTGLNLGATNFDAYQVQSATGGAGIADAAYITDLWIRSVTGASNARNEDFEGDIGIATLFLNGDTEENNWTPRFRKNLGTGILDLTSANNDCVSVADAASLEVGSGDYTIEGFVRFSSLPTGTQRWTIFGKWQESGNQRSWQLYKAGPDVDGGNLVFRTSTDGTAGTVVNVHSFPWVPLTDVWYYLAVSRVSGQSRLFVGEAGQNTVQLGVTAADAATYYNGTANVVIGAEMSAVATVIANTSVDGFMDETRFTVGVGRYTAPFATPSEPFPRNVGGDPSFASVQLLCGFDSGINDESSAARTVTARNGAVQLTPDDGEFSYQVIDDPSPIDDTFIEAALVAATGTLSLNAVPLNTETVTLGATTYTFVTALDSMMGPANAVVIGADVEECVDNLVAAITAGAGSGVVYGTGTMANASATASALPSGQMLAEALTAGAAGNSIASTETLTNGSWTAATLTGGQDIPDASEFTIDPLPSNVTRVFSVHVIGREYKDSEGAAQTQWSFVDGLGAEEAGAMQNLTINPSYRTKLIMVDDPSTGGILTPVTFSGARIKIDRTL